MSTVYVSGPMRHYKQFNFPAFDDLSEQLRGSGYTVVNPADHDREVYPDIEQWEGFAAGDTSLCPQFDLHEALAWDLQAVASADEFVLLPGWEDSSGATHERYVAEVTGKPIWLAHKIPGLIRMWRLEFDEPQIRVSSPARMSGNVSTQHDRDCLCPDPNPDCIHPTCPRDVPVSPKEAAHKRVFDTGATRDVAEHKPDPEGFLSPLVIRSFNAYMHENRKMADGSLRSSDNWQKGIPLDAYMKSMWRHFLDVWTSHRCGLASVEDYDGNPVDMEHALNGVLFNAFGYLHEILKPIEYAVVETPNETIERVAKRLDKIVGEEITAWTDTEMKRVDL